MNVVVYGLWHLGCVTAACVAAAGNRVVGLDLDDDVVSDLRAGVPPLHEPGLGKAIEVFRNAERVVLGVSDDSARSLLGELFAPFTRRIEWMSVESAEMTKHALNAFLATSVTFANELARLCEAVGANAKEVERGLKSEARIGPKAYLSPGAAFAGGTLARDVRFLTAFGREYAVQTPLLGGVLAS